MNSNCNCNRRDNNCMPHMPFDYKYETNIEDSVFPTEYMYGYTYVPRQTLKETFKPEVGLMKGTIFPELVSEWHPGDSAREMEFLRNSQIRRDGYYV